MTCLNFQIVEKLITSLKKCFIFFKLSVQKRGNLHLFITHLHQVNRAYNYLKYFTRWHSFLAKIRYLKRILTFFQNVLCYSNLISKAFSTAYVSPRIYWFLSKSLNVTTKKYKEARLNAGWYKYLDKNKFESRTLILWNFCRVFVHIAPLRTDCVLLGYGKYSVLDL